MLSFKEKTQVRENRILAHFTQWEYFQIIL